MLTSFGRKTVRLAEVRSSSSDQVSFEAFYMEHRSSIGRALAVTLRDDHLASEALDEAMLRAYQRWSEICRLESPAGWVYTVGLNISRSALRRAMRSRPLADDDQSTVCSPVFADPDMGDALRSLSVGHRAVVVCRYLIGYSEAETARVLKVRPGTVKSRLHRALGELQRRLADRPEGVSSNPMKGDHHD